MAIIKICKTAHHCIIKMSQYRDFNPRYNKIYRAYYKKLMSLKKEYNKAVQDTPFDFDDIIDRNWDTFPSFPTIPQVKVKFNSCVRYFTDRDSAKYFVDIYIRRHDVLSASFVVYKDSIDARYYMFGDETDYKFPQSGIGNDVIVKDGLFYTPWFSGIPHDPRSKGGLC